MDPDPASIDKLWEENGSGFIQATDSLEVDAVETRVHY